MQMKEVRDPVVLEGIHSSGRFVARYRNKNVYLGGGIPGEKVTFTLDRRKRGFHGGSIEEILDASPDRITPGCRHYRACGGCPWQHIRYSLQLELKHRILCNALEKYGIKTPQVPPVIPAPETREYRHRVEYTFTANAYDAHQAKYTGQPALGYHMDGEPGRVVAISECSLQGGPSRVICEGIEKLARDAGMGFYDHEKKTGLLRSLSVRISRTGEVMVVTGFGEDRESIRNELLDRIRQTFPGINSLSYTIHVSPSHGQFGGPIVPYKNSQPFLYERICGLRFRVHAASFFQPNATQAERIMQTAREWAGWHDRIYDLYSGVGVIALVLAGQAGEVIGIEGSPVAVEDAIENARLNGIHNARFLAGDILETFKPRFTEVNGAPGLVVLDPPRSGTLIEIKKTITGSRARNILYLSCNPVSLAFDLKQLTEVYRVSHIQPFDMLPDTHHVETLVLLERC